MDMEAQDIKKDPTSEQENTEEEMLDFDKSFLQTISKFSANKSTTSVPTALMNKKIFLEGA